MILDVIGTSPTPEDAERWESEYGRSVREAFLYSTGGRSSRSVTRYRLSKEWVEHPGVVSGKQQSPEYPTFLTFFEFDNWEDFLVWEADPASRWDHVEGGAGGTRCLFRAQYERLNPVLERGPRHAQAGFNVINLVGTFVEDPTDQAQIDAWRRVYDNFMTHSVFNNYPDIKRLCRFVRAANSVDGQSERPIKEIPPMLTWYEFDSWEEFVHYHHYHHSAPDGAAIDAARMPWAEKMSGVKAPNRLSLLYRVQYDAIESLSRLGALGPEGYV